MSSNNFSIAFFTYIKMFKDLSPKYYQNNKERLKKSSRKISKILKEDKEKNDNMVVNGTKFYQKMKNKSLLNIEKNITK